MILQEEWRDVPNFEGRYQVSSFGNVQSIFTTTRSQSPRSRHPTLNPYGYLYLGLSRDGSERNYFVHILVAAAFIGPKPLGLQVHHKNGVKTDCRLENLEYVTASENCLHRARVLKKCRGENHYKAVYSDEQVAMIRQMNKIGISQRKIATCFGTRQSYVSSVINHQTRTGDGYAAVFPGRAKLDELRVREIKVALRNRTGHHELARRYSVDPATIWKIEKGLRWKRVTI